MNIRVAGEGPCGRAGMFPGEGLCFLCKGWVNFVSYVSNQLRRAKGGGMATFVGAGGVVKDIQGSRWGFSVK